MKMNLLIMMTFCCFASSTTGSFATDPLDEMQRIAQEFVEVVDRNDAKALQTLIHPEMMQFVQLNGKLIPFKTADFVQMVKDKKIGGKPRSIELQSVNLLRDNMGEVSVRAISDEYDFIYRLSFTKQEDRWIIVGIMTNVVSI